MLGDKSAVATIAVKDIDVARKFYGSTLGLKEAEAEEPGVVTYRTGNSEILVYESQYAGTNRATAATWGVGDDLETVVQDIRSRGVAFEHYDLPDTTREGDIHVAGDTKVAWFKDPDGNILAIVNQ